MAIGARLRGILDELFSSADSTEGLINELTYDRGYPESVAERIAYGELDMRPGAIAERRRDFAPNMETFYHGGAPNIGDFGGKNERGYSRDATFVSDSPMLANTYVGQAGAMDLAGGRQHGQIYPLAVDTRDFMYTSARGQNWEDMQNLNVYDPKQGIFVVDDGKPFYSKYKRGFDTDELMELSLGEEAPGIIIDDVVDVGPNFRAAKKAYRGNKDLYQDFLDLERGSKVMAVNDPSRIRSLLGAAFDPEYKGSNILGERAIPIAGAGLLAAAAMSPEEAEAGLLGNLIKAGYPEEVAQRIASGELPMDYASRMERARSQDHDIHEGLLHGSTHDITNFDASLTQQQNDLGQGIYLTDRPFDVNTNYAGEGPDLTNRIERLADELESTMESSWSWNADFWDELPGGPQGKLADEIENLIEEGEYRAAAEKASKALSKGDNEGVVYPLTVSKAGMADSANTVPMPEYFDEAVEDLEFDANNLSDEQYDEVMDRVYELEADDLESPIAKAINIAAQYGADFPAYNIEPGMTTFEDMHRYFQMTEAYDDAGEVVGGGQMMNEWLRDLGYTGYVDRTTPEKFSGMGAGVHTIVFPGEEKNIRSFLSAAYDPKYTGPNILGGTAAGALGLTALMAPEEAEAGVIKTFGREFDPRFDPRVKEQEKLQDTTFTIEERGTQDAPRIPLADLEGRPFVTTMSDRTQAGGLLTGIDDVALNRPINLQGGQGFMFENPGMVWASAPGVVNQIMRAASEVGDNPVYLPFRMAPTGSDFATMTGETMLSFASSNMTATQKKALDKAIKDYESVGSMVKGKRVGAGLKIKDWKGVDDPSSVEVWRNTPDTLRKELMNMMDVQFRDQGGLSIGQARLAVTEPGQANALDARIQNIGEIFTDKNVIEQSGHPSYPAGVPGQGLGRTDQQVGIFELLTDARFGGQQKPVGDPQRPTAQEIRALQMKPYTGRITEDILRGLEARGVNLNSDPIATAAAVAAGTELEGLLSQLPQKDEEAYSYGDFLPIKRALDPEAREGILGGYSPAYTGIVQDLVEGLLTFKTQAERGLYNPTAATDFLL